MNKDLRKVVILLAHPNMKESQANKALIDAVSDIEGVAVFNLLRPARRFFLMLTNGAKSFPMLPPSFINFPFIDGCAVITKKMAGRSVHLPFKTPAVAGKPLTVVTTTGSEYEAYRSGGRNRFTVDEPFYVLIRLVLFIRVWRGRHLLSFTEWELQMQEKNIAEEPTCISNG